MKQVTTLLLFFSFCVHATSDLEKTYWDCDYVSTTQGMSLSEGVECVVIYDKLVKEKFKGSFENFLNWWKENKDKEHSIRRQNSKKS
jgi:hypothetical protein